MANDALGSTGSGGRTLGTTGSNQYLFLETAAAEAGAADAPDAGAVLPCDEPATA